MMRVWLTIAGLVFFQEVGVRGLQLAKRLRSPAQAAGVQDLLRRDSVEEATEYVKLNAKKYHNTQLMQLAGSMSEYAEDPDALGKVKDLVRHMIARALTEQSKDTSRNSFCKTEMAKSDAKLRRLSKDVEKSSADVDMKSAKIDELKEQITDLHDSLAEMEKESLKEANERAAEKDAYDEQKAKFESEDHAALRGSDESREEEEERIKKRIEAEQKERDEAYKYKEFQETQFATKAKRTQDAKQGDSDLIRMDRGLFEAKRDLESTKDELNAAQEYTEKLKRDCTVGTNPAAERKERREQEIETLKEAHQMLTGEAIPVDLSF